MKRVRSNMFSNKTMVSIDDQQEVLHGLFKEPILGPLRLPVLRLVSGPKNGLFAPGGEILIRSKKVTGCKNGTDLLYKRAKYAWRR